ncbi:hypothetical protein ACWD5Z_23830 [Micromonospora chokoriensis]
MRVVFGVTQSSDAEVLAGALLWQNATQERWASEGELDIVTASVEVDAWCADTRRFDGQRKKAWKSVINDFRTSTTRVGLQLQSTLRDSVHDLMSRMNALEHAIDAKQTPDQIDALIAAARPAAQTLWKQLHSSDAVGAAWEDLCRACLTEQPEWDSVSRTRDAFVHLASLSGYGSRMLSMQLSWVVMGEQHAVDGLSRSIDPHGPSTGQQMPLEERLALCAQYLALPGRARRHVVWFALRRAMLRQLKLSFGAIDFYYAPILHAVASGPQRGLLPAELQDDSPFALRQMPDENDVVLARVDLGSATMRDPVREAKDVLVGTLGLIRFNGANTGNWQLMTGFAHAVDDHVGHHEVFWARDEKPRLTYLEDPTPELLSERPATTGITQPHDHRARELRAAIRWCDEAEELGAAAATLLYVRVVELFASQLPQKQWYEFLDEYVKPGWVRDRMRRTIYDVVYGALHPEGIFDRSSEVAALRAETYTYRGSFEETTPSAMISALARLAGTPGITGVLLVRVRGLQQLVGSQTAVQAWHDDLQEEWDALRARLRRVRNSLAHGGPYTDEVIDSLASYSQRLARTVLNWGIDAMKSEQDIGVIAADLRDTANAWAMEIPTAGSAPLAVFGSTLRP